MNFQTHAETAWQNTLKFLGPIVLLTLVQLLVSTFSLGILAPVTMAGYMQSLLLALRHGREPELKDLFSEMRLFFPLLGFGVLVMIALTIGFTILILPGILMTIALVFGTLYMAPLMTDQRLDLMDALKGSWEMATRQPLTDQIIVTVLYLALVSLGGTVVVAILFTQPLATMLILSVYEERLRGGRITSTPQVPPVPPVPPAPPL
jgi:ABC-type multidrug transport system permease subunit